jgi:RimJ/RimL family protein N-acetyltransferase
MPIPWIVTPNQTLRPFHPDDALALHRILNEDKILQYYPSPDPPPLDRVKKFIERQLTHWDEHGYGWWAVVPTGSTELAGWNGLQFLPETGETEVGFLLSKAFWNQGLTTEGAKASLDFGFTKFDFPRIIGLVHPENLASQRVLKKIGLSFIDQAQYFGMQLLRYAVERP